MQILCQVQPEDHLTFVVVFGETVRPDDMLGVCNFVGVAMANICINIGSHNTLVAINVCNTFYLVAIVVCNTF